MYSQRHAGTYKNSEDAIIEFTNYRNDLLNEHQDLLGEESNMKDLLLHERWKVQELNHSKNLQNKFSELQFENEQLKIKYNELLKERNDVEMKLNYKRFENFEFKTYLVADYSQQIRKLKQETTNIRNINEIFKNQINNYKIEIQKLQDPKNKLTLEQLYEVIQQIRQQNKKLQVENEVLEKRNIWFRNQINILAKEIDSFNKKITEINEQQSKRYRFSDSQPKEKEKSRREDERKRKDERKKFNEIRRARGEPLLPKSDDDSDDDEEEHQVKDHDQIIREALKILNIEAGQQDKPYIVLGLNENPTQQKIRKAYLTLALKIHPDKHKGDASYKQAFLWVNEAYETLMDQFPVNSWYNVSLDSLFDSHLVFADFNSSNFQKSRDVYKYCV